MDRTSWWRRTQWTGRRCGGGRNGQDVVVEEDAVTGRRGGGGRNGQDVVVEEDAMDRT